MFPLDSKEPYIKENGFRSTLGEMFGDAGADVAEVKAALDDEIKTRAALGAHNLFKFLTLARIKELNTTGTWEDNVYTVGGVTYTVDAAIGTVTVNGTAPSNDDPTLALDRGDLSKYSGYDLSGYQLAETNGYMQIEEVGGSWTRYVRQSNGQKATIATIPSSTSYMFIRTQRGKTITNSVVSPMMTLTTDADDTFTPYAKTNVELTADTSEIKISMTLNEGFNVEPASSIIVKNGICYFNPCIYGDNNFSDTTAVVVATLPTNCRPGETVTIPSYNQSAAFLGVINIKANGEVEYKPSNLTKYFGYVNAAFPVV